jgi:hypothetical protein
LSQFLRDEKQPGDECPDHGSAFPESRLSTVARWLKERVGVSANREVRWKNWRPAIVPSRPFLHFKQHPSFRSIEVRLAENRTLDSF